MPPEVGIMQLCGAMAKKFDAQRLIDEIEYNIEAGAKTLINKWELCYNKIFPKYFPGLPTGHDSCVLENWWYPIKLYNSNWEPYGRMGYVVKAFEILKNRSPVLLPFIQPIPVKSPKEVLSNYRVPDATKNPDAYFKVLSSGRWIDGYGRVIRAQATIGSIGAK